MTPEDAAAAVRTALECGPKTQAQISEIANLLPEDVALGLVRLDRLSEVQMGPNRRWGLIGGAKFWPADNVRSRIAHHEIQRDAHDEVLRALRAPGSVELRLVGRAMATIERSHEAAA